MIPPSPHLAGAPLATGDRHVQIGRRCLLAGAVSLAGCDRVLSGLADLAGGGLPTRFDVPATSSVDADVHLLNRATFGPRPGDLEELRTVGREAWIAAQLAPDGVSDVSRELRTAVIDTPELDAGLVMEFPPEQVEEELVRHTLLRAVYSRRQLLEVVTEAWTDHFHVAIGKGACRHLRAPYDREVLRAHALGSFRDLLGAVTCAPAMLVYLDGAGNERAARPNENHARELLELHTLGAHGGYTQRDVQEVARCLTGFVVEDRGARPGSATFVPSRHDDGAKTVLGREIPAGGGAADVERVLDLLAEHPSTARRVAHKLCAAFVADDPPEPLVARAAATFTASGGQIRAVVRDILESDAFDAARGAKVKRPFRFLVSALRGLGADTHARGRVASTLARMGHAPFAWPTPDGYPSRGDAWLGTLLERARLAIDLARGALDGARVDLARLEAAAGGSQRLTAHLLGRAPTTDEATAIAAGRDRAERVALAMASPSFQRF